MPVTTSLPLSRLLPMSPQWTGVDFRGFAVRDGLRDPEHDAQDAWTRLMQLRDVWKPSAVGKGEVRRLISSTLLW